MSTVNLEKIIRIDQLIQRRATGTPENLAVRLNVSKRMVYHYIKWMKDQGAPIVYCNSRNSYFYQEDVQFFIGFK